MELSLVLGEWGPVFVYGGVSSRFWRIVMKLVVCAFGFAVGFGSLMMGKRR
jgi:hypothetical protein